MPTYKTTINISANTETTWKLLSEVAQWHTWLPTVTSVEPLDQPTLKLGARYAIIQPKLQPATWIVTRLEPPHRFTWESHIPGIVTIGDHLIEELQPGQIQVTLVITFSGFMSPLIGLLYGRLTQSYIEMEAKTLKAKIEAGS